MELNYLTGQDLIHQFNDYQLVVGEVLGGMDAEITRINNSLFNLTRRICQIEEKLSVISTEGNQGSNIKSDSLIIHLEIAKLLARVDELEKIAKQ
jgi:hypothetical protein